MIRGLISLCSFGEWNVAGWTKAKWYAIVNHVDCWSHIIKIIMMANVTMNEFNFNWAKMFTIPWPHTWLISFYQMQFRHYFSSLWLLSAGDLTMVCHMCALNFQLLKFRVCNNNVKQLKKKSIEILHLWLRMKKIYILCTNEQHTTMATTIFRCWGFFGWLLCSSVRQLVYYLITIIIIIIYYS